MARGRRRGSSRSREEESNVTACYCHVTAQHLMVPVCYKQSNTDLKVVVMQAEEKGLMKERHSLMLIPGNFALTLRAALRLPYRRVNLIIFKVSEWLLTH